jgi:AAA15 family ATPase/GTPase
MNIFHAIKRAKSQFIVTTHESTLLDLELLRRDEIWFVDKTEDGNSKLFSLNKFKERYDKKVEKAYLLGRYGAVPVFKSFENVTWDE